MDRSSFESADPIIDQLAELINQTLESDQLSAIRQALVQLSKAVGPRKTPSERRSSSMLSSMSGR